MGGSTSKPTVLPSFQAPDITKATFSGEYISALDQANRAAQQAASDAVAAAGAAASRWKTILYSVIGLIVLILVVLLIHDLVIYAIGGRTWMLPNRSSESTTVTTPPSTVGVSGTTAPLSAAVAPNTQRTTTIPGTTTTSATKAPPNPLLYDWWYGDSASLSGTVDANTTTIVPAATAPLSAGDQGAYSVQWWMYIKDWNYGYGKEKPVLIRPDASNQSIMNPKVVLHPTDNSLRVSISVFPSEEGASSKNEPAPANNPESSDDVFTCEVPNVPLQSWFSVSLTVFGRNLDIYLNGMLVKSCFMSGVPKPAVGDIQVTPGGGFSGKVCGLVTSPRMLNPSDALSFYSTDVSCRNQADKPPSVAADTTGYSVKFGVYDAVGKQVREYTF